MPAKQLLHRAMVAMPVICLACLGAKTRLEYDPYEFACPTPRQNAEILAYKDVVAATAPISRTSFAVVSPAAARKVSQIWLDGAKSGRLTYLAPVSYDDSSKEGIKGEISSQNGLLSSYMLFLANKEIADGHSKQGVQDALTGLKLIAILKYSDYASMMQSSLLERRGIHTVCLGLQDLKGPERKQVSKELEALSPKQGRLEQVAQMERFMFIDYLRRMGVAATRIEAIRPFAPLGTELPSNQFKRTLMVSAKDDTLPEAAEMEKMAATGEADIAKLYKFAIKSANSEASTKLSSYVRPISQDRESLPATDMWIDAGVQRSR